MKIPKPLAAALAIASLGVTLTACSTDPTTPAPTTPAVTQSTEPTTPDETPATEAPAEPATPVADEYSQVIDGVLYQGTEKAPVRIGTDVPGQAPAAEAGFAEAVDAKGGDEYGKNSGKYALLVFPIEGEGWSWKIFGMSRHGSYREIGDGGYSVGQYFGTREEALAGPFTLEGRELDRAEYIMWAR